MILITGASGVTGKSVIRACAAKSIPVRACIHSERHKDELLGIGATEVVIADMMNRDQMRQACEGVQAIYHICPTMSEDEREIGKLLIDVARQAGVAHFVFQSVLHSILDDMPHHAAKHDVERMLAKSGLSYTVIQPAVLMQNLSQSWNSLVNEGVFMQKYFTGDETRMNMVDFDEVADVVASILSNPESHDGATYELCGPQDLTRLDMLASLETALGKKVEMRFLEDEMLLHGLEAQGASDYRKQGMLTMFRHYNNQDFVGSDVALTALLGRTPKTLEQFVKDHEDQGFSR